MTDERSEPGPLGETEFDADGDLVKPVVQELLTATLPRFVRTPEIR